MSVAAVSSNQEVTLDQEICTPLTKESAPFEEEKSKTAHLALLFFKSPLVWSLVALGSSFVALPLGSALLLTAIVFGGMAAFPKQIPKALHYEVVMADGIVRKYLTQWGVINYPYYNEIFPGMYLGALPLKNFGDKELLTKTLQIKAVLMALKDEELNKETFFTSAVKKEEWKKEGLLMCQLSIDDMTEASLAELHEAADFIKAHEGEIYIHCKAGRGRSVMCLMAYLMKYREMSYEEALRFAEVKRPIIALQASQKEKLKEFCLNVQQQKVVI
jgi:protein-tyrosine phosphatase